MKTLFLKILILSSIIISLFGCLEDYNSKENILTNLHNDTIPIFIDAAVIDTNVVGVYTLEKLDIYKKITLNSDGTYYYESYTGLLSNFDKGFWRKKDSILFLKPKPNRSYYVMKNNPNYNSNYLSVYDNFTQEKIFAAYNIYNFLGLKSLSWPPWKYSIADSMTKLPKRFLKIKVFSLGYVPILISLNGRKGQQIDVYLEKIRCNNLESCKIIFYKDGFKTSDNRIYQKKK